MAYREVGHKSRHCNQTSLPTQLVVGFFGYKPVGAEPALGFTKRLERFVPPKAPAGSDIGISLRISPPPL